MSRRPPVRGVSVAGLRPLLPWLLATWFIVISAMRLLVIAPGGPGFDGRLYRAATVSWLAGGDPWLVSQGGVYFGAPPPSLLPMIPFALLPETIGVGILLVLGLASSAWAIHRLRLPMWWLAFPPLVDGMWNANPHVLVLPLIVAGLGPLAVILKVYAAVVPVIRTEFRVLLVSGVLLVATAPFLPWGTFLAERSVIQTHLDLTAGGGLSVWAFGWPLLPIALVAALVALLVVASVDRDRAAWLAMPAFWPFTQWYYSSIAIPGVAGPGGSMLAAAILAVPLPGGPVLALIVCAVALTLSGRRSSGQRLRAPTASDPP